MFNNPYGVLMLTFLYIIGGIFFGLMFIGWLASPCGK